MKGNLIKAMFAVLLLIASAGIGSAHFTMVFPSDTADSVWDVTPEDYIAELGDTKTIFMMWGHPYEHILFDMSTVPEISVMKKDGTVEQLTPEEITVDGMDEDGELGTFKAYKASFTVDQDGDTVVFVKYEDEDENMIDYTKAVIHCGVEMWEGWDTEVGQQTEIIPYMRPYGMEEGFVFAGKAMYNSQPLTNAPVEIEIYHTLDAGKEIVELAEEMFPYDPPMIFTRLMKSNDNGEFVYSLDEPGIWFIGATMEPESGQNVRGVFIVPVLEAFPPAENQESGASSAELQQAVAQARQAAEDAQQAAAQSSTPSTPGFGIAFAVIGLVSALFLILRRK